MHMADALISPAVGGAMLAATTGLAAYSLKKIQNNLDTHKIPLMGVVGAFVFAAQMINFSIPGTGSSGHIGGGLLLAAMLGPTAGFLTMAAILLIQALFFADGGLLAYGCNVINLGFYTCLLVYPLIYRPIARRGLNGRRIWLASVLSSVLGLQLGAFSVALETLISGQTELPFRSFVWTMQPIHLAIGLVEGLVTASILSFVWKAQPELLEAPTVKPVASGTSTRKVLIALAMGGLLTGGILSLFASSNPDGLEWSMFQVAGATELESSEPIHLALAKVQEIVAILPDYGFKTAKTDLTDSAGISLSGLVGGALTLVLTGLIGLLIVWLRRRKVKPAA